jgi:hypothetical protein
MGDISRIMMDKGLKAGYFKKLRKIGFNLRAF